MKVEFKDGFAVDFKMAVAECFKDSLAKERFNTGDIIYNDRQAYLSPWSEALKHIHYGFQIIQMTGDEIEYDILVKTKQSLAKIRTVKVPINAFVERLQTGLSDQELAGY
jgi:hypothetical protein